jgi:hypothetical protein
VSADLTPDDVREIVRAAFWSGWTAHQDFVVGYGELPSRPDAGKTECEQAIAEALESLPPLPDLAESIDAMLVYADLIDVLNDAPKPGGFDHTAPEFWFRRYRDWLARAEAAVKKARGEESEMER